jgi:hypothetical protein
VAGCLLHSAADDSGAVLPTSRVPAPSLSRLIPSEPAMPRRAGGLAICQPMDRPMLATFRGEGLMSNKAASCGQAKSPDSGILLGSICIFRIFRNLADSVKTRSSLM